MDNEQVEKLLRIRAAVYADEFLSNLTVKADPRVKDLSRSSLMAGWIKGYAAAMADIVIMRDVAREVKH